MRILSRPLRNGSAWCHRFVTVLYHILAVKLLVVLHCALCMLRSVRPSFLAVRKTRLSFCSQGFGFALLLHLVFDLRCRVIFHHHLYRFPGVRKSLTHPEICDEDLAPCVLEGCPVKALTAVSAPDVAMQLPLSGVLHRYHHAMPT